jgi:predicted Rossmann fold nucleotide-binding protein DprA/Smf involved in DNA uptake
MSDKKSSEKPAAADAAPPKKKKRKLSDKQKAGLKELRALKGEEKAARLKETMNMTRKGKKAVKKALEEKPLTVPEIAEKTDLPTRQVLWLLTSLRKYGEVKDGELDGDYPRYELVKS